MPGRILVDTAPLRQSRDFRLLFIGQLISTLGNQMTMVAIPFQVYGQTHSSLQVGAVSLAQLVPLVVGSLVGGSVGDAVDRRTIMIGSAAASMVTAALLALNAVQSHPSLVAIYVVSALAAGLAGFANPARNAIIPTLVADEHLIPALAFVQIVMQVGGIAGPAIAGLLLGPIGATGIYAIDGASFGATLLASWMMAPIPAVAGTRRPGLGSIAEGFKYLRGRQGIQGAYAIDLNAMIFGMPRALFPALARTAFGGGTVTLGFLYAAPGAGALLGAVTTGWVNRIRRQGRAVTVAVMVWGVAITGFGLVHLLWVALVLLAVAGWADVISAVLRNTIIQTSSPEEFRSRLSSIQMAVVQGGPRLGDMEAGGVASALGNEFSIVSGGLACVVGAVALALALPGFRHHSAAPAPADQAAGGPGGAEPPFGPPALPSGDIPGQ